ncbi:tapasin-related protein-like [Rhinophrynus dorsalis]
MVKDSSVTLMQYLKGDTDKLNCEIKPYFTDNIQILWPGIQTSADTVDSWFISMVRHSEDRFHMTTFFTQVSEGPTGGEKLPQLNTSQEADIRHATAVFTLSTRTPKVRSKLKADVLLDCAFSVDHQADVTVTWTLQKKKGEVIKLLSYSGSAKVIEYYMKRISMKVEEIPKGNASLLVRNLDLENQGIYMCSVSVASLFGDQRIRMDILESPTVTINTELVLLEEGEEKKLVCDASTYYPLDVTMEWLREDPESKFLPTVLKNIVFSSHKYNNDGTYNLSSFFMFTASILDDGAIFTCRVEHASLVRPIKRRVKVRVKESAKWSYDVWLLVISVAFCSVILLPLLKYTQR